MTANRPLGRRARLLTVVILLTVGLGFTVPPPSPAAAVSLSGVTGVANASDGLNLRMKASALGKVIVTLPY